jgi:hypothetical protein
VNHLSVATSAALRQINQARILNTLRKGSWSRVALADATLAMQDAAYGALQGEVTPEAALSGLQTKLEALTQ